MGTYNLFQQEKCRWRFPQDVGLIQIDWWKIIDLVIQICPDCGWQWLVTGIRLHDMILVATDCGLVMF